MKKSPHSSRVVVVTSNSGGNGDPEDNGDPSCRDDEPEEDHDHHHARRRSSPSKHPPVPSPPPLDHPTWKKFAKYGIDVDEDQDDKATEILLCSAARPHMRAFHCAWWSFFVAFFIWFSVLPLLPYMAKDLNLTKQQIWTSNIAGVGSTIAVRFIIGPLCDVYGPRILFSALLCLFSIPAACTGLVQTALGLTILRAFIGVLGGTFVVCEYWCSRMFAKKVVGTAQGLAAGWGNLGAGVTNLILGNILMPIFIAIFDGNTEIAWRTVCVVPALTAFVTGVVIYRISDDAPKGNYVELRKYGQFPNSRVTVWSSWKKGSLNHNSWIMFVQYAACFGVELAMNQASALYFKEVFGQSTEASLAIGSIFGWLNLFARGLGGFISDWANVRWGMQGRLWAQTLMLFAEGGMVFVFSNSTTLGGALVSLVVFSLFVQATEALIVILASSAGTNMAIVPYIDPRHMGTVTGITGAGGNVGAVAFGLCFRQFSYNHAFLIMGCSIFVSAVLSVFVRIPGHAELLWGRDRPVNPETGELLISSSSTRSRSDASGSAGSGRTQTLTASAASKV